MFKRYMKFKAIIAPIIESSSSNRKNIPLFFPPGVRFSRLFIKLFGSSNIIYDSPNIHPDQKSE